MSALNQSERITLYLDNNRLNKTNYAGDILTGRVVVRNPRPSTVDGLELVFEGRVKTKVTRSNGQSSTTYRGRAQLFRRMIELGKPQLDPNSGEVTRSYEMQVPMTCESGSKSGYWDRWDDTRGGYRVDDNQILPASGSLPISGWNNAREAYVSYRLTASVRGAKDSEHCTSASLLVRPQPIAPSGQQITRPQRGIAKTYRLNPDFDDKKLTTKQSLKSFFHSEDVPMFFFDAVISMDAQLVAGQKIVIPIIIKPLMEKSTCEAIPEIRLAQLNVELKSYTNIRCKGSWSGHITEDFKHTELSTSASEISGANPPPFRFGKHNEFNGVFATCILPNYVVPSYSTFNINHKHRLKINLELTIKDKTCSFVMESPVLVLTGPAQRDFVQSNIGTPDMLNAPMYEEAEASGSASAGKGDFNEVTEQLPSYKEALT